MAEGQGEDAADAFKNGYDAFWHAQKYAGKVAILDDQREALAMALQHRGVHNINTENAQARAGGRRTT